MPGAGEADLERTHARHHARLEALVVEDPGEAAARHAAEQRRGIVQFAKYRVGISIDTHQRFSGQYSRVRRAAKLTNSHQSSATNRCRSWLRLAKPRTTR